MKQAEMQRLQLEIHQKLEELRQAGQKEYAHGEGDEVFANFHRVGHALGIDRKKVLFTYMQKHIDGVTAAINGHMSQREPVYGRIMDTIVYLELLYGMFLEDERHSQLRQAQVPQAPQTVSAKEYARRVFSDNGIEGEKFEALWEMNGEQMMYEAAHKLVSGGYQRSQLDNPLQRVDNPRGGLGITPAPIVDPGASLGNGGGSSGLRSLRTMTESEEFSPEQTQERSWMDA